MLFFLLAIFLPDNSMSSDLSAQAMTLSSNSFALKLYQALSNADNLVVSPIGIHILLTLVKQGAKGVTADEICRVIDLPANNDKVLKSYKSLNDALNNSSDLQSATNMFVQNSFGLVPDFQRIAKRFFLSEIQGIDFKGNPQGAREEINSWVEIKTNDKIKDLLSKDAIDPDTEFILVNAIHFKAKWEIQFDIKRTTDKPFYVTPNNPVNVKMMAITDQTFRYMHSEILGAKIVELPYDKKEFSMCIILPDKVDGLSEVESKLYNIDLPEELSKLQNKIVDVFVPRFKIESTINLKNHLIKLGMVSAFTNSADFSGLSTHPVKISSVFQKAFIEVNEEGTEAAAATTGVMRKRRAIIDKYEVVCNHPFGFIIIHASTGNVIFESRIISLPSISPEHHPSVHEEL